VTDTSGVVCVDASVIVSYLLPEELSAKASWLWSQWEEHDVIIGAPAYLVLETCHAIRKAVRSGLISPTRGDQAVAWLASSPVRLTDIGLIEVRDIWDRFVCAFDHLVTPYDAGYLYVAEMLDCELWTADDRLVRTVGEQLPWVRSLSERLD
jgi:predicted nucleic acid-binding protein